jgi:two-component system sensor histidine kinase HydH
MAGEKSTSKLSIFSPRLPFKLSRTALSLILATIFLAALLTFSTVQNINRAEDLMERFLQQKGETVINAIEAAMKTSLMHHWGEQEALHTLLTESSRANDIVFVVIADKQGNILSHTDNAPEAQMFETHRSKLLDSDMSVSSMDEETGIMVISRQLSLTPHLAQMPMMMANRGKPRNLEHLYNGAIISIGLFTEAFDAARRQDVEHAIFMGAILFLVGSAGLYLLFMYQRVRVARSTLSNMRIYTENVIESIPVGLVTLDGEDKIVSCNRKIEELLGRPFETIEGKNINDAFPDCLADISELRDSILDHSAECKTSDGKRLPVKIGGSSLVNSEGENVGTVLVVRDMSLIRDMELQLERSRRMAALGKMAAGIAHEIRNPLGTLRGFAHYFGKQAGAAEDQKRYAELMESEIDRLNRNISGLLQFARPREPNMVRVDLDKLFAKIVALMERDISEKNLNLHYQCNTDIQLESDQDMLVQVMMNLLKNSISATPPGGEISLSALEEPRHVRIAVSDNGVGMTEEEREQMFDPFFTTRNAGTGLGLAVSHQFVEQLNGAFEVKTVPGKGTSVTIVLPKTQGNT